jgi:hypothetical protein
MGKNETGTLAALQRFWVHIGGQRGCPRVSFGCFAVSSVAAAVEYLDLARPGERVEVVAAGVAS